jgi:hypothetical protein
MRFLAFDHFFWQDLDEIEANLGRDDSLVRISYLRWHRVARSFFPDSAFHGIENAFSVDLDDAWNRYRNWVDKEVHWIIAAYQPNLFIVPSDSFFYLRPIIESFKKLDLKTYVLQKETTISPLVMEEHSQIIGRFVPFMSDHMSVCSHRHKEFWLKASTEPSLITVTGQPRFDFYARPRIELKSKPLKKLLYLSYDDSAYLPSDLGHGFTDSWLTQRQETECVISEMSLQWDVTVKTHPQQENAENWLGSNVIHADRFTDTRHLIAEADVLVGFQTTAIYEGALAGKPVIYAAWGEIFEANKSTLIRFDLSPGLVNHAKSPKELKEMLENPEGLLKVASEGGLEVAVTELGPVDGNASQRVIQIMRQFECSPQIPYISNTHPLRGIFSKFISFLFSLGVSFSRIFKSSKSEAFNQREQLFAQVARESSLIRKRQKEITFNG